MEARQPFPYKRNPSRPSFTLPPGTVDTHCHIFGPADKFPYAPGTKQTPIEATKEQLWQLRDHLGIARNVIVQAAEYNDDNSALLDALNDAHGRTRGIGTIKSTISAQDLQSLHDAGIRGVRFGFVKHLPGRLPPDEVAAIANRIAPFGWHCLVFFAIEDLPELYDLFTDLPTDVVVDHMGRPDVTKPVDGPEFGLVLRLLGENENFWCKIAAADRLSQSGPDAYADVVPFARRIVETFPDRVLWGTDWPHPKMFTHAPDDGKLVDFIPNVATTAELQHKLLVANPMRLYWPEED